MNQNTFLKLTQEALTTTDSQLLHLPHTELNDFYEYAAKNRLLSVLYKAADNLKNADSSLLQKWKDTKDTLDIDECRKILLVKQLLTLCNNFSIHPIFFKGYILADLYPEYTMRYSSDTDIYIPPKERNQFENVLITMGYERDASLDKTNVHTYRFVKNNDCWHKIELHFSLFEDFEGDTILQLKNMNLTAPDSFIELNCCNMNLWTLGHSEHLIYQIFHMIKHFIYQGINLRYLIDISLFLKSYVKDIDMTEFWNKMDLLNYTEFCKSFLALCCQFYSINEDSIQLPKSIVPQITASLLQDIVTCGTKYYDKDISHYYLVYAACYEKIPMHLKNSPTFSADTIPYTIVPKEYQENLLIRNRLQLMKDLKLL